MSLIASAQIKPISYFSIVGENHNKGLDKFFLDYSSARVKNERLNIDGLNSYLSKQSIFSNQSSVMAVLSHPAYVNNRKTGLTELPSSLIRQRLISELCGSYISAIDKIIDNDFEGSNLNINLSTLENKIFNDVKLSETEKEILLSSTSVAKSSSGYWLEKLPTLSTQWTNSGGTAFIYDRSNRNETSEIELNELDYFSAKTGIIQNENNETDKASLELFYGCGKKIVKGDIAGAAGGAVAGSLVGGVGAVPGAFAGALSSSVYESVMCFLDWLF